MALTLYWAVYPSTTADYANNSTDAAKIAAGQDSTGAALPAGSYGSQAYSAAGVIDASSAASGLTAGTAYVIAWTIGDAGVYGGGTATYVVMSADVTTAVDITGTVSIAGAVSVSGDIQIGTSFDLAQTAAVALTGSASVSGDIQSVGSALDLAQTAAIALTGSASVSGDIQIGTSFDLTQTNVVALSGSTALSGDVQIGVGLDLVQTADVALSVVVEVSGDIGISSEPVVEAGPVGGGGWAWAAPRKKGRYSYLSPPTREEMAERVRKQREALGILPKSAQKRIENAVKKEARRTEPSLAPLAPVAAEVAQDTGIALQAVVDAIKAAFENQRGLVLARMQADAARNAEAQRVAIEQARLEAEAAEQAWQQRLLELRAADDDLLRQDEESRQEAIATIRQVQQALLALIS